MICMEPASGLPDAAAAPHAGPDPLFGSLRFDFDSDDVRSCERIDTARDLASRLFGGLHVLPTSDPAFKARFSVLRAGDLLIGRGEISKVDFKLGSASRGPHCPQPLRDEDEGVLWMYRRGGGKVRQGAVDSRQDPGSAFFMHSELPGDGITDGTSVLAINLSSKPLRRAVGHNRHIGPASLAVGNPLVDLLAGYVESATRLPENVEPALLGSISSHIVDLVALALGPTRDAAEQAAGGGLKSARLDAVLRVISERYAEPDFTVADVAAKLNLSVRYVQDILHETGNGFSERVLELRLREACGLLGRGDIGGRKVSDIAFSCGFNSLSYFHRAFRRRFGMTPAGARAS